MSAAGCSEFLCRILLIVKLHNVPKNAIRKHVNVYTKPKNVSQNNERLIVLHAPITLIMMVKRSIVYLPSEAIFVLGKMYSG